MALGAEYGSPGFSSPGAEEYFQQEVPDQQRRGRAKKYAENAGLDPLANSNIQVGGDHYSKHETSPWDVYEDWFGKDEFRGYLLGCIVKYIVRYRDKGGILDLNKARHVLDKLIEVEGK